MKQTYSLQRMHINKGNSVQQIIQDWPYLMEDNILLQHCQELLGFDLRKALADAYLKKGSRMLKMFRSRKSEYKLEKYLNEVDLETSSDNLVALVPAVILCLQRYIYATNRVWCVNFLFSCTAGM